MLRLTAEEIDRRKIRTVGLLATDGTIQTGIYERLFEEHGVTVVKPDAEGQKQIMALKLKDILSIPNITKPELQNVADSQT